MILFYLLAVLLVLAAALSFWRLLDHRADTRAMQALATHQPAQPARFNAAMVADLPEPARRYFLYTIKPDTALNTVARLSMHGQFGMGNQDDPNYLDFKATQVLASPAGFVWKMRARRGLMHLSGSDSQAWTRFWLMGLVPVAHMGGDEDHRRSAFGRYVAEAVFWTPAAVLPGQGIVWEQLGTDRARVTIQYQGLSQSVDLTVTPDGQPTEVRFERWSNANPDKQHRLQPFGGYLSDFRWFDGFRLPAHVEAGNQFGTDAYFPFFVADITAVEYPRG